MIRNRNIKQKLDKIVFYNTVIVISLFPGKTCVEVPSKYGINGDLLYAIKTMNVDNKVTIRIE